MYKKSIKSKAIFIKMIIKNQLEKVIDATYDKARNVIEYYENNSKKRALKKKLLLSFKEFVKYFWDEAGTSNPFSESVSINAICACVDAIIRGELGDTLIHTPQREGKSTLMSILLPVFLLLHKPRLSFLTASYSTFHALHFNTCMQDLIKSKKFKDLFGNDLSIHSANKEMTKTKQGGTRRAVGFDGSVTGSGGTVIILDDPNDLGKIRFKSHREKIWQLFARVFYARRDNFKESVLIGVMHRSHDEDLFGKILAQNDPDLTYVVIPFLYDPERHTKIVSPYTGRVIWEDKRKKAGELTSPHRYTEDSVKKIRRITSVADFQSLYQGDPTPKEGNIIKLEWFKKFELHMMNALEMVVMSIDTALSSSMDADFSAITSWGIFRDTEFTKAAVLLNVWYDRLDFPELLRMLNKQMKNIYDDSFSRPPSSEAPLKPHMVIIEEKANGANLIQCLRRMGHNNILPYKPKSLSERGFAQFDDAKVSRVIKVTPLIESGKIYLPVNNLGEFTHFSQKFINACTAFPNSGKAARDVIDTFSQALDCMEERRILVNKFEAEKLKESMMQLLPHVSVTPKDVPFENTTYW